jgi:hypothetical protein
MASRLRKLQYPEPQGDRPERRGGVDQVPGNRLDRLPPVGLLHAVRPVSELQYEAVVEDDDAEAAAVEEAVPR